MFGLLGTAWKAGTELKKVNSRIDIYSSRRSFLGLKIWQVLKIAFIKVFFFLTFLAFVKLFELFFWTFF
jgi:hypothetical protein